MYIKGFRQIIIGLLFLMLNFYINGFDIIPDFVGYILIIAGLSSLSQHNQAFSKAMIFGWILLIFCLFGIFQNFGGVKNILSSDGGLIFAWFYSLITLICAVGLRLLLGKGMVEMLEQNGHRDEARKTTNCITLNIIVLLIIGILTSPPLLPLGSISIIIVPLILTGLAAGIWLMVRINRNSIVLENGVTL